MNPKLKEIRDKIKQKKIKMVFNPDGSKRWKRDSDKESYIKIDNEPVGLVEPIFDKFSDLSYLEKREIVLKKSEAILSAQKGIRITIKNLAVKLGLSATQYLYYTKTEDQRLKAKTSVEKFKQKQKSQPFFYLKTKVKFFQERSQVNITFNFNDVIKKFGENPICYLTGLPIDYNKPETYQLDHFIPASKGGSSDLENMRLANPMANEMKNAFDLKKFVEMCVLIANRKEILSNPDKM